MCRTLALICLSVYSFKSFATSGCSSKTFSTANFVGDTDGKNFANSRVSLLVNAALWGGVAFVFGALLP